MDHTRDDMAKHWEDLGRLFLDTFRADGVQLDHKSLCLRKGAGGGQPAKLNDRSHGVLSITPRRSFEKWIEKRLGYCRPWAIEEQLLALGLRVLLTKAL